MHHFESFVDGPSVWRNFVHGCVKEKTKASGVGSGENHLTSDLQSKESCEMSLCVNIMQKKLSIL